MSGCPGTLEDVGKSVLICDVCEEIVSKFDARFGDGDPCPHSEDDTSTQDVDYLKLLSVHFQ